MDDQLSSEMAAKIRTLDEATNRLKDATARVCEVNALRDKVARMSYYIKEAETALQKESYGRACGFLKEAMK